MRIEFTGRQTDVPDLIRRLAERKLGKLERLLPGVTRAHVVLSADKHRQIAEVSLHSRHLDLSARESSGDLAGSLVAVVDKLARQAERQIGKRRNRGRTAAERTGPRGATATPPEDGRESEGAPVIRRRRLRLKPMTVDEAAQEVLARREGFVVFRDARTERVSVLYRQTDGNLALIEPEA